MIYQEIISVISKFIIYTDTNELYCSGFVHISDADRPLYTENGDTCEMDR